MKHIHVLEQRAAASLDLGTVSYADLQALPGMEFRAAEATGRYDFEHQVALRNQYWNGLYGYALMTPLIMENGRACPGRTRLDPWRIRYMGFMGAIR